LSILGTLGYRVIILGFLTTIYVFFHDQRQRRKTEIAEMHPPPERYDNFLCLALSNANLLLFPNTVNPESLTEEQQERRDLLFRMLVSLFENAFIILYQEGMSGEAQRRWLSQEEDMWE